MYIVRAFAIIHTWSYLAGGAQASRPVAGRGVGGAREEALPGHDAEPQEVEGVDEQLQRPV